ncbi:hypothetical protein [Nocardioides taihuensis]|uniref:Uncharacterized protein n=1 Tax=Nocardioides taihuensis TaxID=1835606 RepID=A0ABW0BPS3_9ACTN
MVKVWDWGARSHERALDNARAAATALHRARLERAEVDLWFELRGAGAEAADQPA